MKAQYVGGRRCSGSSSCAASDGEEEESVDSPRCFWNDDRPPASCRGGVHRFIRSCPGRPPEPGENPGRRGQPARWTRRPHAQTGEKPAADLRVLRLAKESVIKVRQSTANATSSARFAALSLQPGRSEEGVSCRGASSPIMVQPMVAGQPHLPPLIARRTRCQAVWSAAHATSRACARASCRSSMLPMRSTVPSQPTAPTPVHRTSVQAGHSSRLRHRGSRRW